MPTVTVLLNGRNYDIACGPGEEERVQEVAARLRERMEGIAHSLGNAQEQLFNNLAPRIGDYYYTLDNVLQKRYVQQQVFYQANTGVDAETHAAIISVPPPARARCQTDR